MGLPTRVFFYTIDQVADMLGLGAQDVNARYLFKPGRDLGPQKNGQLLAVNIAPEDDGQPEWRISEDELIRWLRHKRIKLYRR